MKTYNPYPQLGEQLKDGLDYVVNNIPSNPIEEDLVNAVYNFIQPLYYPNISNVVQVELKSVIWNMVNAYQNNFLGSSVVYSPSQQMWIAKLLACSCQQSVNALENYFKEVERGIVESGLSISEQTPLLLGSGGGKVLANYWMQQISGGGQWINFFDAVDRNYLNVGAWVGSGIEGILLGARASERGLIAPTTDIVSVELVSALIGGIVVSGGKVLFRWVKRVDIEDIMVSRIFSPVVTDDLLGTSVSLKLNGTYNPKTMKQGDWLDPDTKQSCFAGSRADLYNLKGDLIWGTCPSNSQK
ncbi:MAG: hypothetical protein KatS3mg027_2368 [Bacteroidia bacterium]|nr:MAG: hypothetical protein KatS3mg027_2368 [Bacteroidia bacterium]